MKLEDLNSLRQNSKALLKYEGIVFLPLTFVVSPTMNLMSRPYSLWMWEICDEEYLKITHLRPSCLWQNELCAIDWSYFLCSFILNQRNKRKKRSWLQDSLDIYNSPRIFYDNFVFQGYGTHCGHNYAFEVFWSQSFLHE